MTRQPTPSPEAQNTHTLTHKRHRLMVAAIIVLAIVISVFIKLQFCH